MGLFQTLFGTSSSREVKKITPLVDQIEALGDEYKALTDEQLFQHINDVIVRERLFLDSRFERQTIMDRFQLSKERVGAIFAKGSQYAKLTDYTQELRLEYSTILLSDNPDKSISQVADESGFSSYSYYCKCFRQRFGMTPSEFRMSSK